MAPMYEQAAQELEPADDEPRTTSELGVAAIPTLLLLHKQIVARSSGAMDTRRIIAWVQSHLPAA